MSDWRTPDAISFEERLAKNNQRYLDVYDARPAYCEKNGGMARQFQIPLARFKPSTIASQGYVVRREPERDFAEVIVWDWSDGKNRFSVGDISPEKAEADIQEKAKKLAQRQIGAQQPMTDEQKAEHERRVAEAEARTAQRARNFHVDALVLAGCDEEEVEAAIDEIGMPAGCAERRAGWVNRICQRLGIDIVVQSRLRRVLCGRE